MRNPSYERIFERNVGAFSKVEINRIRNLRVAIAGAGGFGGTSAYLFARLGVHTIRIADQDGFELSNINRQFGASIKTVGKNKAKVVASELSKINPYLKIDAWPIKVDATNVDSFLDGIDVVIDAVDFFNISDEIALHKASKHKGLMIFSVQAVLYIFTLVSFNPQKSSLTDFLDFRPGKLLQSAIKFFFPVLPKEANKKVIADLLTSGNVSVPSYVTVQPIGSALIVEGVINALVRRKPTSYDAPKRLIFDLQNYKIVYK